MAWYENCPPNVELVSVATLDSIFEMEQFIPRLDESKIPWRVVEHDSTILKDPSINMGYATLYVGVGYEEEAITLLKEHRLQQSAGRPCPECGLWLGPNIIKCPACGYDLQAAVHEKLKAQSERSGEHQDDDFEEEYEDDDFDELDDLESVEDRLANLEDDFFDLSELVHDLMDRMENLKERIDQLEKQLTPKDNNDS